MSNTFFAWSNHINSGALSAGSSVPSLPVSNLNLPQGAPSLGWQTATGATTPAAGAWAQIDNVSGQSIWRAFLLARTNLTTGATVRWRVGSADALVELIPALVFDVFGAAPILPAGWTFSRASAAYSFDATGTLVQSATNALRVDYDPATLAVKGALFEPATTNGIRNPRAENTVTGTPGSPPTNWTYGVQAGVAVQTVGFGSITGIPYVDVRFFGTATSGLGVVVATDTATNPAAATAQGQTWTSSAYLQIVAGTLAGMQIMTLEADSGGATLASVVSATFTPPSAGPLGAQRFSYVYTTTNAAVAFVRQRLVLNAPVGAIDFTLRIGLPQLEKLGFVTSPMMPAVGARVASTRAADIAAIAVAVPISWGIYADMTVAQGTGAAQPLAITPGSFGATTSTFLQTSGITAQLVVGDGASGTLWTPSITALPGQPFKTSFGFDSAGSFFGLNAATPATTTGLAMPPLTTVSIGNAGTAAQVWVRRLAYYAPKPSNLQLTALASTGSSLNAAALTYDSGTVSAGIIAGYGQTLTVSPADVVGRYCRVDISDPTNPDGFINIPLMFAGPAWNLFVAPDYASMIGRDDQTDETVTRGGQEYPVLRWARRRWEVVFTGILAAELGPQLMELDRLSRDGRNVLFVLDTTNGNVSRETVFGRCVATKDMAYPGGGTALRGWSARITERL